MNKYHLESENIFADFFVKHRTFAEMSTHIANRFTEILMLIHEEKNTLKLTENIPNVANISYRKRQLNIQQFSKDLNKLSEITQRLYSQYLLDANDCIFSGNKKISYLRQLIFEYEMALSPDLTNKVIKSLSDYQTTLDQIDRLMAIIAGNVANIVEISANLNALIASK
ncbi:hypothetical protein AAKU64_004494 [Undibacterium sp. GrIS 1.8]|uniref:hypothetical protein n=1 Tax=Undibacterium sp. GrIS 1.8 TaxID=3143934 RepID=UPI00339B0C48